MHEILALENDHAHDYWYPKDDEDQDGQANPKERCDVQAAEALYLTVLTEMALHDVIIFGQSTGSFVLSHGSKLEPLTTCRSHHRPTTVRRVFSVHPSLFRRYDALAFWASERRMLLL